jgi:23S rRNA pseudouridine1911/1915/1917 synthase
MPKDLSQFLDEVRLAVTADEAGQRLDHFLTDKIFWRSRTDLQNRIKRAKVLVNDRRAKPSTRLQPKDRVRIIVEPSDLPDQDPASIELEILHEEPGFVVVSKQAGLVVHPTGRHVYDTLMNALFLRYRENGEVERGVEPHVVHRLDRDTSGVICVAKNFPVKQAIAAQFEARTPRKGYLALVEGLFPLQPIDLDAPLGRDEGAEIKLKMCVREDGLASRTRFEVVERFAEHSLVRALPKTGRQHQIRVHLAHLGHPILCDPLYGDPRSLGFTDRVDPLLERQALHAETLTLRHPERPDEDVTFRAPLAADMQALIAGLREDFLPIFLRDVQSQRWQSR